MAASAVLSRFRGALVGALIGDCLGANFEGDIQIPINSVLQHFSAVKTYPRKKEGNNCTLWLAVPVITGTGVTKYRTAPPRAITARIARTAPKYMLGF